MSITRTSKYIDATRIYANKSGHFTNTDILSFLRKTYPELSATTVHRITSRMINNHELQYAPSGPSKVKRFDSNLLPHDHFMCEDCGTLRDADLSSIVRPEIENVIGNDCSISGSLTVSGICKKCSKEKA